VRELCVFIQLHGTSCLTPVMPSSLALSDHVCHHLVLTILTIGTPSINSHSFHPAISLKAHACLVFLHIIQVNAQVVASLQGGWDAHPPDVAQSHSSELCTFASLSRFFKSSWMVKPHFRDQCGSALASYSINYEAGYSIGISASAPWKHSLGQEVLSLMVNPSACNNCVATWIHGPG